MANAPDWTLEEFKILLDIGGKPSAQLSTQLPNRTAESISIIQQGIHAFHIGNDHSMLSRLMVDHLQAEHGYLKCPVCGRVF